MPDYRSKTSTHGRNMAGARARWRAPRGCHNDIWENKIAIAHKV